MSMLSDHKRMVEVPRRRAYEETIAALREEIATLKAAFPLLQIQAGADNYVMQYGGRCRDCADYDGICPNSHLPCDSAMARLAIRGVVEALNYGLRGGFICPDRSPAPAQGDVAGLVEAAGVAAWRFSYTAKLMRRDPAMAAIAPSMDEAAADLNAALSALTSTRGVGIEEAAADDNRPETAHPRDPKKLDAKLLTDAELTAEQTRVEKLWDSMFEPDENGDVFEGHGGSPGEWMQERMMEIAHEQARRAAPPPPQQAASAAASKKPPQGGQ